MEENIENRNGKSSLTFIGHCDYELSNFLDIISDDDLIKLKNFRRDFEKDLIKENLYNSLIKIYDKRAEEKRLRESTENECIESEGNNHTRQ